MKALIITYTAQSDAFIIGYNDSDDAVRDDDDTVWDNGSVIVHADGYDGKSMTIQSSL